MPSNRLSRGTAQRQSRPAMSSNGQTETQRTTIQTRPIPNGSQRQSQGSNRPLREYSPPRTGEKLVADVGLIEVEFLACLLLLVLLLFTNTSETYANRVMSFMKRGTLLSVLFFVLSIVAASGQNAAKIAKGIGGMVFVATLLTTPSGSIFTALDSFFKADWAATNETANDTAKSADAGTASGTAGSPAVGAAGSFAAAVNSLSAAQRASSSFMDNFTSDFIKSWNLSNPKEAISATADQLINAAKAVSDVSNAGTNVITGIWHSIFG